MHSSRIALAFVLAGLAAPALAEKCSVCDFTDEPIVVKPTKQSSGTGAAPGGMTATLPGERNRPSAPAVSEIVVTKLSDSASPNFRPAAPVVAAPVAAGTRPVESLSMNYTKIQFNNGLGSAPAAAAVRR